ncbi:hypothetical protein SRHO_G00238020 [Serrasalmus rhombeus]
MSESESDNSNIEEFEEQDDSLQHNVQHPGARSKESFEKLDLQGAVSSKREKESQGRKTDKTPLPRCSSRPHCPTEKMLAFQKEEALRKEKRLLSVYEQWKIHARQAREQLMSEVPESQLGLLIDTLEKSKGDITKMYSEIRHTATPPAELRRRVDACEAVTKDIVKIAYERIVEVDGEFNAEHEKGRLQELLNCDYAHSVYGSVVSKKSSKSSLYSATSLVVAKWAEAAAELAAREAEFEMLIEEEKQLEKIEQQQRALEAQRRELERLQAEKELKAARARVEAYEQEATRESVINISTNLSNRCKRETITTPPKAVSHSKETASPLVEVSLLAQAFQDSVALNRLPVPEPFVFNGDPIQFMEWKSSFQFLIDKRCISSAEKLFYLKKYVGGPARKALDGTFYRNDNVAFQDAWSKLNQRYGQPFTIQRAFQTKLANWSKIHPKDALGLRDLSDFLISCQEAMPYVKGLEILNDCEENQKIVQKLPDWIVSRWNRQVTQALTEKQEFPSFKDFTAFVAMEAEVACNPVTSFHALHSLDPSSDKRNPREHKKPKANVLSSQAVTDSEDQNSSKKGVKLSCVLCQDPRHQLHGCLKFTAMSLEERRNYVKERKLCYACLKFGHNAKECRHRHTCNTCKGRHPTCLHDNSYVKKEASAPSDTSINKASESTTSVSLSIAGESSHHTSMIVPVWVSTKSNPCTERLVYALLDTQSDTTFVDQGVSDILQAEKYPVKLKLTTMSGKGAIFQSERVSGLCVRGYSSAIHIDLPSAYTKDCIPVNHMHIPTCESAKKWAHLSDIGDEIQPYKDCEIGLLMGYNCPRAMAPKQVILGGDDEPFAIRTDLGWSVVGRSSSAMDSPPLTSLCHRISVKEVPLVTPADVIRVLESDFKDGRDDSKTVSQDDVMFLNKLGCGIQKNTEGHYEMPLPFKRRPSLPDNKNLAILRLNHLKRKLSKDQKYKEHYVKFMEDVISKGDAEEVHDIGLEAPFVLNGKMILQEMCRWGTGWDDNMGDELQPKWERWRKDLAILNQVTIPRSYTPVGFGKITKTELHHFSDASTRGYGQCSYLRFYNERGDVHCALVIGKSRVAPTKVTTIPRLELTAALVSVKISSMLKEELSSLEAEEFFWTDSKVVLGYIRNEARRFHTFVANRVQKIHLGSHPQQWRYVASNENPADHASRGLTLRELLASTWLTGPEFLWKAEFQLPADETPELDIGDPEVRAAQSLTTETTKQFNIADRLSRFSSWSQAVRAVARILRCISKNKSNSLTTVEERENAESVIIKNLQGEAFQNELGLLSKDIPLPSNNRLHRLNPFIDRDGVLKVRGRLCNSSLDNSFKHPIILPKDHHITRLIIAYHHEKVEHQGKGLTLNEIRANGYWMPGIGRTVASYIHRCVNCRKLRKPVEEQRMADLPPERVEQSAPFTYCGMDCFGPFPTKQGRKVYKRYGLIFTCFYSRAIHIEMLDDMSTDAFINSLRCFIAIRTTDKRQIKSDQGSNFVGAKRELKESLNEVDPGRIATFLAEKQCDFIMNAPCSSHAGGVWERQIRTVRNVLRSTIALSSDKLNDASLRAFQYEAMAIVNSRPLTVDNLTDPDSLEPLTPNHLLTQKSNKALPPPGEFIREDMYGRKRWRHVQYLAEQFWSRWRKEYLATIATRQRWHSPRRNVQPGDIVMLRDDNLPRYEWRLGRVSEITPDKDGLVRRVRVQLGDRHLEQARRLKETGKGGERGYSGETRQFMPLARVGTSSYGVFVRPHSIKPS